MDGIIISEGAFAPLSCSAYLPHLVDLSTIIAVAREITAVVRSTRFFNISIIPHLLSLPYVYIIA